MSQEILIFDLGRAEVLSGAPKGQMFFGRLVSSVRPEPEPCQLFLNFAGVHLMTSSFFRESILPFRDYAIEKLKLYPVLANVSDDTLDEIKVVLEPIRDAVILCTLRGGRVSNARLFGILEDKQQLTLEAVLRQKETDAGLLKKQADDAAKKRRSSEEKISITGWNNRLAALVAKGLLIETKRGRGKLYRPVLEFSYGQ